jgi:PAS domain S-box-containing protein
VAGARGRAPLRLLLVEDDRELAASLVEAFAEPSIETSVVVAATLAEAQAALREVAVDAVLLDLGLPDSRGLDTIRALRDLVPAAAILVVSGEPDDALLSQAIAEGAQDCLVKGSFSGEALVRAVRSAVARQRLLVDLRSGSERLRIGEPRLRGSQADLEARVRQQAAVAELGAAAVEARQLEAIFERAAGLVAETLAVEFCGLLEALPGGEELLVRAGRGWPEGIVGKLRVDAGPGSQSGYTLQAGVPVVTADLATETRFRVHPLLREHGVRSGASVVVPADPQPWGVINAHTRELRTFTTDDVHFLEAVAHVIGSAVSRQRAETALREQEARFRGVVESLDEGVLLTDLERITYANRRALELTGYTLEGLIGQRIHDHPLFVGQDDDIEQRLERRRAGSGELYERSVQRADGSTFWAQVHGSPFRDAEGRIVGTVAAFADVSARRAAERARGDAEARLRQVMARSPAVLFALTPTPPHAITWMSDNAGRILGFGPDDFRLLPDLWSQRVHPDDRAKTQDLLDALPSAEDMVAGEYRFRHVDGHWLWLTETLSLVRGEDGSPLEIVGACQDVTGERHLEEQLRQAQKMEAVGRLAGGVAHDFNNLLTAIGGYSELLLMRLAEDDPARHDVEEIRRAGERAAALTRQLLAFSRRQVVQPRVLDLNDVIRDTERMLRRLIGEDVRLATRLAERILPVKADPGQLEQVLLNLAVNARDAMPLGGRLTIGSGGLVVDARDSRHPQSRPGSWVFVQVVDTGVGMSPDVVRHIFEPFFTTKEVGKGTGLGLSTVYGIVDQSGGWIEVDSEPGSGSAFTVWLPEAGEPITETAVAPKARRSSGGEVILVVEDEPSVRALVSRTLLAHGYVVLEASNGAEALALAGGHQGEIQLLLTDVVMPDLRGPELRERLVVLRPGLRTVFMSGYSEESALPTSTTPGVSFLQKPFTPERLTRALREILDRPPPAAVPDRAAGPS